ncbi:MAG: cache domain-containing protein, partial [Treponema sp.]|nr:cache domain-containing protein [Treponema sp.]
MKDIRFKIMVIALVASIVAMGTVTISRAVSTGNILIEQSLGRVEYHGALIASRINSWLENQIGYLNAATEDLSWIMETYDDDALQPMVEAHYKNYSNNFFQMFFGYPDGSAWFSNGWEPPSSWQVDKQEWYSGALQDPYNVYISDPYLDPGSGSLCVAISKSIIRNGKLLAIVGADIYLDQVRKIVNEIPVADGRGSAFLIAIDSEIILVHSNIDYMPKEGSRNRTISDVDPALGELLSLEDGTSKLITRGNGIQRYYNGHTIPSARWKLFSTVDREIIQGPILRQTNLGITL